MIYLISTWRRGVFVLVIVVDAFSFPIIVLLSWLRRRSRPRCGVSRCIKSLAFLLFSGVPQSGCRIQEWLSHELNVSVTM